MLTLDLKTRFRNKAFIIAMVSAVVLLVQQLGFKDLIPANYLDIEYSILSILTMLGIIVDTSTPGVSDSVAVTETVQASEGTDTAAASDKTEIDQDALLKENELLKAQLAQITQLSSTVTQ